MIKINGVVFGNDEFLNGEAIYIKPTLNDHENIITMFFEDNKDIGNLVLANIYLDEKAPDAEKYLIMPYIPYSRMDREIDDQIFSLKYFSNLINSLKFNRVVVADPHSNVSNELFNNLVEVNIEQTIISKVLETMTIDIIMFPDKGARTKYTSKYIDICNDYPVVYGEKIRDLKDKGKIVSYELITNGVDAKGKTVLIIDDLCSYGNTFKFASNLLTSNGAKEVNLFVTHAEDTILHGGLLLGKEISKVFTTNSVIRSNEHENLISYKLF